MDGDAQSQSKKRVKINAKKVKGSKKGNEREKGKGERRVGSDKKGQKKK